MREGREYQKLGELVKVINGLWVGKKPPFTNVAVVRNANFTKSCTLDMSNIAYIDVEEKQFNTRELQYADIIIEKSGGSEKQPVGRPVFFNIKDRGYSFSNFTATLRVVSSDIVPEYLYKVLLAQYKQGVTKRLQSKTTGLHNLDFKSYLKSVIPIPSCEKQLSIVSELDKINELIRLKKEQLKDYDNLAQSIFYEMFGDPIENEKGWEVKKLREVCECITDGDHMPPPKSDQGVPFVTIGNINKETRQIEFDKTFFVPKDYFDNIPYTKKPKQGDILYTVTGSYGIPILIAYDKEFCFQRHIGLLRPNGLVNSIYLYMWASNKSVKGQADVVATGIAQKTVSLNSLRGFNIILPPLPLQQLFAQRIELIEQQKAEIQSTIADLETLLASRMQYWFD